MQEVVTIHENFLEVCLPVALSAHMREKQICLKMQHRQSNAKQIASSFTHSIATKWFFWLKQILKFVSKLLGGSVKYNC